MILFLISLYVVFNSSYAQTKITQAIGKYLGNKWNTTVSLDRISLEPFRRIGINNLYIEDQHGDTLIFAKDLKVRFKRLNVFKGLFHVKSLQLNDANFFLKTYEGEDELNLAFITNSFSKPETDTTIVKEPFRLSLDEVEINNTHFIFLNQNIIDTSLGMHYADLDVDNINALLSHISIVNDSIHFHIESMNAREKSGVILHNFLTEGHINGKGFDLQPLIIKMNNSYIDANQLKFEYGEWGNFLDFINKVEMTGDFNIAQLVMEDIAPFSPSLYGWKQEFKLIGKVNGKVNNLSGYNLTLKTGNKTSFEGNFNIDGLPDIKTSFITVEAKHLYSELSDLENIQLYPFADGKKISLPASVKEMGDFTFKGDFTGFLNDFVAYGIFKSKRGIINSDLSLKQLKNDRLLFSGRLKTKNLDLGILIGNKILGKLDCNLEAELLTQNGAFVSATMNGKIDKIDANEYAYTNIILNGKLRPEKYSGALTIDDPAINLDFKGLIELSNDSIILDFDTELFYADLGALKLLPIKDYSSLSGKIQIDFLGKEWTSLKGNLDATEVYFCKDTTEFKFGHISLKNDTIANGKKLVLDSDIISGEILGDYNISTIPKDIIWEVGNALPAFIHNDSTYVPDQDFNFHFTFHDVSFLQKLEIIDIRTTPESYLFGKISPAKEKTNMNFISDSLYLFGVQWEEPEVHMESTKKDILIEILSQSIQYKNGPTYFQENELASIITKDTLDIGFNWLQTDSSRGELNLETVFLDSNSFIASSRNSRFTFLEKDWFIANKGTVKFDKDYFSFHDIELATALQNIKVNGNYGESKEDTLQLEVNNFELANFNYMLQQFNYRIAGWSNGYLNWIRKGDMLKLEAELEIDSAAINDYAIGDIMLLSEKTSEDSSYHVKVALLNETYEKLKIEGSFNPYSSGDIMNLNVDLNDFDLNVLNYTNLPGISNIRGMTKGMVNFSGSFQKPRLNGHIDIEGGGLFFDILGIDLTFDNNIDVFEDYIAINPFNIYDNLGQKASATGTILHENLKDWNYDFFIEVDKFMVMDLKNKKDALFYGKAFGTGEANIWGYNKLLFIDVAATTNAGTKIFIPIKESNSVDRKEFIEFINKDSLLLADGDEEPIIDISGVDMNLDISVTPEAEVELIFDEATGDILSVKSEGQLELIIDKKGFAMVGSLETYEGEYVFTFESIINKKFSIPQGSKISWLGDPYNANIDISALYTTRASLAPIMIGEEDQYKSRVNTFVYLYLNGQLQSPDISFKIELPDSKERERTALRSVTSTIEDLNKQVVSLLLLNSFQSISGWDETGGFATSNTFELLSNQVSNWLSQISDEVDVNVHYRPGSESSGQEFDVGLTTDILNERVTISTQVGFKDPTINPDASANNIVGDFIIEYKLTEDGRVRLKAFNKSNDNQEIQFRQAPYTQGIGIVFRKDFDNKMKRKATDKEELQEKYNKINADKDE
jgi:hypothetical protein